MIKQENSVYAFALIVLVYSLDLPEGNRCFR